VGKASRCFSAVGRYINHIADKQQQQPAAATPVRRALHQLTP